jgi:hypothetical protein
MTRAASTSMAAVAVPTDAAKTMVRALFACGIVVRTADRKR